MKLKNILFVLLLCCCAWKQTLATTYTVTNTNDSGTGSLRQAIIDANASSSTPHTINFAITSGAAPFTINVMTALPAIIKPVTINGFSQSGFGIYHIILSGLSTPGYELMTISAGGDGSVVNGLNIINANTCLKISGAANVSVTNNVISNAMSTGGGYRWLLRAINSSGIVIKGNKFGTNIAGTAVTTDALGAVVLDNCPGFVIGGTSNLERNLFVGEGYTTEVPTYMSKLKVLNTNAGNIYNNFFGTDITGTILLYSTGGLYVYNSQNINIGSDVLNAGNLFCSYSAARNFIDNSNNITVKGNYYGVDISGFSLLGTSAWSIHVINSSSITIGGSTALSKNVMVNGASGISSITCTNLIVKGNYIGLNKDGSSLLGTLSYGITASGVSGILIGGANQYDGNVISGCTLWPIVCQQSSSDILIQGNTLGADVTGSKALPNAYGIYIYNSYRSTIGGNSPAMGNLIIPSHQTSGWGVMIYGTSDCAALDYHIVANNKIGTDLSGMKTLQSYRGGIVVGPTGTTTVNGNVISGAKNVGIQCAMMDTCIITGNKIGVSADRVNTLSSPDWGITTSNINFTKIGSTSVSEKNYISCSNTGIYVTGPYETIDIKGNNVGVKPDNMSVYDATPNVGIHVRDGSLNTLTCTPVDIDRATIGGTGAGEKNIVISKAGLHGIVIETVDHNLISGKTIIGFSKAIHHQLAGNANQPTPTILYDPTQTAVGGYYLVSGTSEPNNYIEVFYGNGKPQDAVGFAASTYANSSGVWSVSVPVKSLNAYFVATATDVTLVSGNPKNNTSELSNMITVEVDCDNKCISSFAPFVGKEYILTAWVKENATPVNGTYEGAGISVEFPEASVTVGPVLPSGKIIDGWQRVELRFTVPPDADNIRIHLVNGNSSVAAYYDDIRVHPVNASMKSYVYDPITMRLMAELDERNYATFYEYDEEGSLIRVKKETEKGVITIKESRNNIRKVTAP